MKERIIELHKELVEIEDDFLDYMKRKDLMPIREHMNEIQEFAVWFSEKNRLEEEERVWELLKTGLWKIMEDIVTAAEDGDYVLMHDAVTYGLLEYLKIFVPQAEERQENDKAGNL